MANQPSLLVRELAEVFHDREEALLLLQRSGFPMSRVPDFTTPLSFWSAVAEKACNGVLPGGIRRVVDMAAGLYPDNRLFRAMSPWDPSTTQRLVNSRVDPSLRPAGSPNDPYPTATVDARVQALVRGHVDAAATKVAVGRMALVVTSANSLVAISSFSVLLYALTPAVPLVLYPGPPVTAAVAEDVEITLLEEPMVAEEPEPRATTRKKPKKKRGKSSSTAPKPNEAEKGESAKAGPGRVSPRGSPVEGHVVPSRDSPPPGSTSPTRGWRRWWRESRERRERRRAERQVQESRREEGHSFQAGWVRCLC